MNLGATCMEAGLEEKRRKCGAASTEVGLKMRKHCTACVEADLEAFQKKRIPRGENGERRKGRFFVYSSASEASLRGRGKKWGGAARLSSHSPLNCNRKALP